MRRRYLVALSVDVPPAPPLDAQKLNDFTHAYNSYIEAFNQGNPSPKKWAKAVKKWQRLKWPNPHAKEQS